MGSHVLHSAVFVGYCLSAVLFCVGFWLIAYAVPWAVTGLVRPGDAVATTSRKALFLRLWSAHVHATATSLALGILLGVVTRWLLTYTGPRWLYYMTSFLISAPSTGYSPAGGWPPAVTVVAAAVGLAWVYFHLPTGAGVLIATGSAILAIATAAACRLTEKRWRTAEHK